MPVYEDGEIERYSLVLSLNELGEGYRHHGSQHAFDALFLAQGLGNLQPLPSSLNSSKGAQLGWDSGYKGQSINIDYLAALNRRQADIQAAVDVQIRAYLRANKAGVN